MTISPPNSVTVNETTTVDVYCSSKGNPPAPITWRKVNGSLEDERIDVNPSGQLRISGVRDEDRRKYECTAQNVLGVARSFVTLVANGKVAQFRIWSSLYLLLLLLLILLSLLLLLLLLSSSSLLLLLLLLLFILLLFYYFVSFFFSTW